MLEFEYIIIDKSGQRIKSMMKAKSAADVANILRSSGGKPLRIAALKNKKQDRVIFGNIAFPKKLVSSKELVVFTRQLGTILSAGVLLSEALETIATDLENEYFSEVLTQVVFRINGGESFSEALAQHPRVFSPYYIAMVNSGEAVGRLGATMVGLAVYLEDSEKMRLKFLGAIRYPVFLLSVVFLIVSGIVLFLIPKFKDIFQTAGSELPLLTRIVVGISEFSLHYFYVFILVALAISFFVWKALQDFRTRFMFDYTLLHFPIIGKIIHKALIARFCQTFSILLKGGVGIITALPLSAKVMSNLSLKASIEEITQMVMGGAALSEAMSVHADMPRILVKMIAVGEKSGTVPDMLKRMGDYYEQEVETFLDNINSILEPLFIVIIGGVVLVVALALYLPIFKMSASAH